ncbi:hypothetical protein H257_11467 [Aphanomyces astaci]|uniref:Transmembrane protein 135 N-terminal domain-containing protein n=1 Tax=Aphanomyces astaci TaxID=112090 RepID=W4G3B7_APHAT|nr:hypothetical protein H257_11467 [Aphanomyces astaci]ETV73776.1 hypothetical protein H257_11467 [Aphanomyces astaci]|eukprot:XP_009836712.1 hypothetical protein H257_11467 [Aphanomyces astaci]
MERVYSAVFGEDAQKAALIHETQTKHTEYMESQHYEDVGLGIDSDDHDASCEVPVQSLTPELLEQHNLQMQQGRYHDHSLPPSPPSHPLASTSAATPIRRRPLSKDGSHATELSELGGALKAGARAFVLAYGAKAFTAVLLASRKWGVDDTNSYADALRLLSQSDTLRFGGFVGALVGSFRGTEVLLNYVRGPCAPDDATHKAIAGAVSGLSLFLDTPSRRPVIALYIFIRMLDIYLRHAPWQARLGLDDLLLRKHPVLTKYTTEILFALANGPIIYAAAYNPRLLPQSYYNFILNAGKLTHHGTDYVLRRRYRGEIDAVTNQLVEFTPCQPHFHRESCVVHTVKDWLTDGVVRAASLYIPVHFTPLLLFKHRQLVATPATTLSQTAFATFRSSAFLSSYQALVKVFLCAARNICQEDYALSALGGGFVAGLSLFCEDPKRRNELMLYTAVRSLDMLWAMVKQHKTVAVPRCLRHFDVLFFCVSMSVILSRRPEHIKPTYLSLLRFMFGPAVVMMMSPPDEANHPPSHTPQDDKDRQHPPPPRHTVLML